MSTLLKKARQAISDKSAQGKPDRSRFPQVVPTSYTSLPVSMPPDFLSPLSDPSSISVQQIDFQSSAIPEYQGHYAVILENVLSREECSQLIHFAEQSAGAHREGENEAPANDGWRPAMVNAGPGMEYSMIEYRNSDRIVWDHEELARKIWERCLQGEGIREKLERLEGDGRGYDSVLGARRGRNWRITKNGLNERLRFLKYGKGQYFREHCDGKYVTPVGATSFYTIHLYLNDSVQVLEPHDATSNSKAPSIPLNLDNSPVPICEGGATTFHSPNLQRSIDVDPKVGRVLIFQHNHLFHSGAEVLAGTKYTMRSDLMYDIEDAEEE